MIPLLYNHEAKFPIFNNNTVLLLPFSLHACCRFYCIIVAILYVSLLADFTVFVLSDYTSRKPPDGIGIEESWLVLSVTILCNDT